MGYAFNVKPNFSHNCSITIFKLRARTRRRQCSTSGIIFLTSRLRRRVVLRKHEICVRDCLPFFLCAVATICRIWFPSLHLVTAFDSQDAFPEIWRSARTLFISDRQHHPRSYIMSIFGLVEAISSSLASHLPVGVLPMVMSM